MNGDRKFCSFSNKLFLFKLSNNTLNWTSCYFQLTSCSMNYSYKWEKFNLDILSCSSRKSSWWIEPYIAASVGSLRRTEDTPPIHTVTINILRNFNFEWISNYSKAEKNKFTYKYLSGEDCQSWPVKNYFSQFTERFWMYLKCLR